MALMEKRKRGKPTKANKILRALEDLEDNDEGYLVMYDLKGHPSEYFYKNLHRIMDTQGDGDRIQASVIQCSRLKTAKAIHALGEDYGAHVLIFRAELVE